MTRQELEEKLKQLERKYRDTDRSLPESKVIRQEYDAVKAQLAALDAEPPSPAPDAPQVFICYARGLENGETPVW